LPSQKAAATSELVRAEGRPRLGLDRSLRPAHCMPR
jgi:hypothetical protein